MPLYHATTATLSVGDEIEATRDVEFYPAVVALLERSRPGGSPSRARCLFAADSAVKAAAFMTSQLRTTGRGSEPFNVYEVEMPVIHCGAFALIDEIDARLSRADQTDRCLEEYWHPSLEWKFLEAFGPALIVRGLAPVNEILVEHFMVNIYSADRRQAKTL